MFANNAVPLQSILLNYEFTIMKTKLLILSFISALTLLVSCERPDPDLTAQSCLDLLAPYYPYSLDEDFIFVNDSLGERWEAKAYDVKKKGIYPWTHISDNKGSKKNPGGWGCDINAWVLENGVSPYAYSKSDLYTTIVYQPSITPDMPIGINWSTHIYLSGEEWYDGGVYMGFHSSTEFVSHFPDTIVLPINNHSTSTGYVSVPEGSYMRVVKNKGITDLSLDGGQTVWRRVKE